MIGFAAAIAETAVAPSLPRDRPLGAAEYDVVLHALTVMCGMAAIDASSEQLATAMFRARAAAWFRRCR